MCVFWGAGHCLFTATQNVSWPKIGPGHSLYPGCFAEEVWQGTFYRRGFATVEEDYGGVTYWEAWASAKLMVGFPQALTSLFPALPVHCDAEGKWLFFHVRLLKTGCWPGSKDLEHSRIALGPPSGTVLSHVCDAN
jgi:hypothetical protein